MPNTHETEEGEETVKPSHEPVIVEGSFGDFRLSVHGPIAVIVVLQAIIIILGYYIFHDLESHLKTQDLLTKEVHDDGVSKATLITTEHLNQIHEIERNRRYIREVERACLMTPEQRAKMQLSLTPALKELLLEDFKP